ncbi:hypothetical protein FocnCong_v010558 [Fusarium oxysporum f. sp. conglutinans]|nr:hypothetical protein FocnCong_v010558 [Fusarium oxysporum f. sp. conglutinans]
MPSTIRGAFEATSTDGAGTTIADDIFISIILARGRSSKTNVFGIIRSGRCRQHHQQHRWLQTKIVPTSRYDDPGAIYQRYVAARDAWYKVQPRGSIKTNQQYRRALGLPLRYDKSSYQWCLDWKQMGKRCDTPNGSRDWTKEEMMAYLDWSKAEDDRVEAQVAVEMERNPFSSRRGMHDIWEAAAADNEAQQAIHSGR